MSNNFIKYLRNLGVKLKLINDLKPVEVSVTIQQSTVDDLKKLHNVDIENELTEIIKNEGVDHGKQLNQITVKMNILNDTPSTGTTEPVKKKRTYKKRTNKPAEPTKKPADKKTKKNGTTKTTNRKPPKKDSPV